MFVTKENAKYKKHQQMLLYYYREAFKDQCRIDGTRMYKPKISEEGQFLYSYEYMMEVKDYVYSALYPLHVNDYWFDALTSSPGTANFCIEKITHMRSEWLPKLTRNPYIHAFKNGLFVVSLNEFFHFEQRPGRRWVGELSGDILFTRPLSVVFC
jgi:hypothetical protein